MQNKRVSRDTPLAEITLRKYERPNNLPKRDLMKKICLSIGLLQPGDSRDVIIDVLHVLLDTKNPIDSEEVQKKVIEYRTIAAVPLLGIAPSNIRRQLKRLRDMLFVEKIGKLYRINENEELDVLFEEKIKKFYLPSIVSRVQEYFKELKKD
jgi:hypothetical protein